MSELVKRCERCGKEIGSLDNNNSNNYNESKRVEEHAESQFYGCASISYRNDGFKMWQKIDSNIRKERRYCAPCTIFLALVEKFGNKKDKE